MHDSVTLIVHTAWPVNFNLLLSCFKPHIRALHNLTEFSLSVRNRARSLMFYSSVSTALGTSAVEVKEEPLSLDSTLMGY
jgi:hypothetical protein